MLNSTASMAVAFRRLATEGFRPRGTLIYFGVADEEAGGESGCRVLARSRTGTPPAPTSCSPSSAAGRRPAPTASDGSSSTSPRRVSPGCACVSPARPATVRCRIGTDNALVTAAEVVRRLVGTPPRAAARRPVEGARRRARRPGRVARRCSSIRSGSTRRSPRSIRPAARLAHACSHTTISPERRPRRAEDEHDPRRRRPRGRHPHRSRATRSTRPAATSPRPSASWRARSRSACCSTASRHARRPTTSCGTSSERQAQVAYPEPSSSRA